MPELRSTSPKPFPQLVAFDLDYTLWDLWIDTNVTGPLRRSGNALNEVIDKHGNPISFYRDVPDILHMLHERGRGIPPDDSMEDGRVIVAACSRTSAPKLARQCLQLLALPNGKGGGDSATKLAIDLFDEMEIYPGSKLKHFKALHERTGIPYSEMLFFDDEHRNSEVEKLDVTFVHVPHGLDHQTFENGLKKWRLKRSKD